MQKDRESKEPIPTSYSAAIIAQLYRGISFQTTQILLVRNREDKKWGPPAGHIDLIRGTFEKPYKAIEREWREEVGELPMDFSSPPDLSDVIHSYDPQTNKASVGFIYSATLDEKFGEDHFERSEENILAFKPLPVNNGFEKDMVGLFNYQVVMDLLGNWRNNIYLPEINGDTLLKWCNNLASAYTGLYFSGANWSVPREDLGFNWQSKSIKHLL